MINIQQRQSTVPVYLNTDACTAVYINNDSVEVLPIISPVSQTAIRKISVKCIHADTLYKVSNYALSLVAQGGVQRFLLDSTPLLTSPAIVDNLNIFTVYKELSFYVIGQYNSVGIPVKFRLDLFDVASIPAIQSVLTHPDVSQLYIRSDTGYSATTYEMLQSVKHRNKVNIALDLDFDFRLSVTNRPLLNLQLDETRGMLLKIVTDTEQLTSNTLDYKGKFYSKARKIGDLSKSDYFFVDTESVYITDWDN